jgi:hypothetical protein
MLPVLLPVVRVQPSLAGLTYRAGPGCGYLIESMSGRTMRSNRTCVGALFGPFTFGVSRLLFTICVGTPAVWALQLFSGQRPHSDPLMPTLMAFCFPCAPHLGHRLTLMFGCVVSDQCPVSRLLKHSMKLNPRPRCRRMKLQPWVPGCG